MLSITFLIDVSHKYYTVNVQLTDSLDKPTSEQLMGNPTCKASGPLVFWIVTVNSVEIL